MEAVLLQKASFPVCTVRFPIVLGADDYTKRLHFTSELDDGHKSPFGTADSWFMDTTKAQQRGFAFRNVTDWFVPLVRDIAAGRA